MNMDTNIRYGIGIFALIFMWMTNICLMTNRTNSHDTPVQHTL
jgi:hypothetical protein